MFMLTNDDDSRYDIERLVMDATGWYDYSRRYHPVEIRAGSASTGRITITFKLSVPYIHHINMASLLRQPLRLARTAHSTSFAQRRLASSLVYLEHKGGKLNDSSLHAVTAAQKVDGEVSHLVHRMDRAHQCRQLVY
jgi:hypothetical protein